MGSFKRWRYGVLGVAALILCLVSKPVVAALPVPNPAPTVTLAQANPEQQAQVAYSQGNYQTAAAQLERLHSQYRSQGDFIRAAIALGNQSLAYQKLGDWSAADESLVRAWALLEESAVPDPVQAQLLDAQGQLQFARGELDPALRTWQRSSDLYARLGDTELHTRSRLLQAQALQAQGLFQQVRRILEDLAAALANQPDSAVKAKSLRQLGDSFRATGYLKEARDALTQSLVIAQNLQNDALIAATTLSLGNVEQGQFKVDFEREGRSDALQHAQQALRYYQEVVALADGELGIQARLNLMRMLTSPIVAQWDTALRFYPTIQANLDQLPRGRAAIYGYVGLAENLITLKQQSGNQEPSWADIAELLEPVRAEAEALGDLRAQSLVLGTLGHIYEQAGQWVTAEAFSRQALGLSEPVRADDISYRWQWQLGRVLDKENKLDGAISEYSKAFETLQGVRSDLVTANPDVQFSFRESVEPLYRELVDLLLSSVPTLQEKAQAKAQKQVQTKAATDQEQARLGQARDVMEALQVAELENFFSAACIEKTVNIDQVVAQQNDPATVLYAVLLDDRLEVVSALPPGESAAKADDANAAELVHYSAYLDDPTDFEPSLNRFRADLNRGRSNNVRRNGQQLYRWLLEPLVDQGLLSPETTKTLIFVLDGNLRLIPMATLHDGESFLVEKYALSLILGLEVRESRQLPSRDQLSVLAASLTDPPASVANEYGPLPNVNTELDKIAATDLPTTLLRDDEFTAAALERQINETDYTVVHLATHGQFGKDRRNTFILAADDPIDIDRLGQVFRSRRQADTNLEMLILSACKTATGDSREILGIAGATVQSGARSTIATLWSVDDDASVVFTEALYEHLGQSGVSRAEALRLAQTTLLNHPVYGRSPRYWAPYVLVGSWR